MPSYYCGLLHEQKENLRMKYRQATTGIRAEQNLTQIVGTYIISEIYENGHKMVGGKFNLSLRISDQN